MFLMIILGVGFAALNTGNNLLYLVVSLLLAFLTLSGILSESALRGLEIRRSIPKEIFAGMNNPVQMEIKNTLGRVPSFSIVVEDRAAPKDPGDSELDWRLYKNKDLPDLGRVFALRIGPGETAARVYLLNPDRRGTLKYHSVRISTRFPFGLFSKSRTLWAGETVLVYPNIERAGVPRVASQNDDEGEGRSPAFQLGSAVDGLREFEQGDSLRRVHWKSSLRRNQLQVRTQEEQHCAEVEVRLCTRGAISEEHFEEQVRWAAGEVVAHLCADRAVGLVTDSDRIRADRGPRQRARLLSFLALVCRDDARKAQPRELEVEETRVGAARS
jgi:uncharacterized protein (DUF58 family)